MMVAAVVVVGQLALRIDRAAELAAPDDERAVEESPLLEIGQEASGRLVGVVALRADVARQIVVLVPAAMQDLHGADAALDKPAGQQSAGCECAGLGHFGAIEVERLLRFLVMSVSSGTLDCMR